MSKSKRAVCLIALLAVFAAWRSGRTDDSADERRRQIESMSSEEKEQLRRRKEWFDKLDASEQDRLRRLHEQIQQHPDAARLRRVMHGYCQWLRELPSYRRAELLELEPGERIARIKQLKEAEARIHANRPQRKDMEALFRWMRQYVEKHEQAILQTIPEDRRRQIGELSGESRRRLVMWMAWQRWQITKPDKLPTLTADDLADLRSQLSEETRKKFSQKEPAEQWQIVADWLRLMSRHRSPYRQFRDGPLPPDLQEKLDDFFENELSDEQRDRLLSMPGDEMQRELRDMYLMRFRPSEMRPRRGYGPPPGARPDPSDPRGPHPRHPKAGPPSGFPGPGASPGTRPPSPPAT